MHLDSCTFGRSAVLWFASFLSPANTLLVDFTQHILKPTLILDRPAATDCVRHTFLYSPLAGGHHDRAASAKAGRREGGGSSATSQRLPRSLPSTGGAQTPNSCPHSRPFPFCLDTSGKTKLPGSGSFLLPVAGRGLESVKERLPNSRRMTIQSSVELAFSSLFPVSDDLVQTEN